MNDKQWHEIGNKLASTLGFCLCQRKLKSIVDSLVEIKHKIEHQYDDEKPVFTGAEYLLIAILDHKGFITHGTNLEYPILNCEEFWNWIEEVKDNPNLEDN